VGEVEKGDWLMISLEWMTQLWVGAMAKLWVPLTRFFEIEKGIFSQ
jgi:hypothetical protein